MGEGGAASKEGCEEAAAAGGGSLRGLSRAGEGAGEDWKAEVMDLTGEGLCLTPRVEERGKAAVLNVGLVSTPRTRASMKLGESAKRRVSCGLGRERRGDKPGMSCPVPNWLTKTCKSVSGTHCSRAVRVRSAACASQMGLGSRAKEVRTSSSAMATVETAFVQSQSRALIKSSRSSS